MRTFKPRYQGRVRGATLLEWLAATALLAVLWSLANPQLSQWRHEWMLNQATNDWLNLLHRARADAIATGLPVMLCAHDPAATPCNMNANWNAGYTLFTDNNHNGMLDPGEVVLWRGTLSQSLRLTGNTPVSQYVRYHPDGQPRLVSGAFQAGTFTLCVIGETNPRYFRRLVMSAPGRVRIERPTTTQPPCL